MFSCSFSFCLFPIPSMLSCIVLYYFCVVLCCVCCLVLFCTILCCFVLCCVVLCCPVLSCLVLSCLFLPCLVPVSLVLSRLGACLVYNSRFVVLLCLVWLSWSCLVWVLALVLASFFSSSLPFCLLPLQTAGTMMKNIAHKCPHTRRLSSVSLHSFICFLYNLPSRLLSFLFPSTNSQKYIDWVIENIFISLPKDWPALSRTWKLAKQHTQLRHRSAKQDMTKARQDKTPPLPLPMYLTRNAP